MYEYIAPVLGLYVCWRVSWLVIYWVCGLHVGYLSINNGVLLNKVTFKRGNEITASSIRLRLWGNTRKLVISDLQITLRPEPSTSKRLPNSKTMSESPLSVFPSSKISRTLFRAVLSFIRSVDIEIKNITLKHRKFSVDAHSIQLLVKSHVSAKLLSTYKFNSLITILQANAGLKSPTIVPDLLNAGSFTILLFFSVSKTSGTLSDVSIRIFIDDMELHAFQIIKNLVMTSKGSPHSDTDIHEASAKAEKDKIIKMYKKFSPCFKEFSMSFAFFRVTGIPLIPASPDFTLTEYFDSPEEFDTVYGSVESMSIHLDRLSPESAGYDINFSSIKDAPIHVTFSSLLIRAGFQLALSSGGLSSDKTEFFAAPNMSFTFKTNASRKFVDGTGFEFCVLEFFLSGNSPVFDVDHHQLAILVFNYTVWRKILTLRKFAMSAIQVKDHGLSSSTVSNGELRGHIEDQLKGFVTAGSTKGKHIAETYDPLPFDKAIALLKEYLPRIDIKLTVEQPRIIVRAHSRPTDVCQMLIISYSLMVFRFSTMANQEYDAECQFVHPSLTFSEKCEGNSSQGFFKGDEEVLGLADVKLILNILKDLHVKTKLRLFGLYVKLSKPDALNGLHDILGKTATSVVHNSEAGLINAQCDQKLLQAQELISQAYCCNEKPSSTEHFEHILRPLPSWFVSFDIKIEDIEFRLGSASPLLPPDYISELSESAAQLFAETDSILKFHIANVGMKIEETSDDFKSRAPSMASSSHGSLSLDTLAEDTSIQNFWTVSSSVDGIKLGFYNDSRHSTMVSIPSLTHQISATSENSACTIFQECVVQSISINLDRHKLFAAFGLAYLILQTIISPLQQLHKGLKRNTEILQPLHQPRKDTELRDLMSSSLKIERIDTTVALSDEFKVKLLNYDLSLQLNTGTITVSNHFTRVMVDSSTLVHHWDRVLCVDSLGVTAGNLPGQQKVLLNAKAIRFIQPHGFVVHRLFDNLSIFMKIAKHLASCFRSQKKETLVSPKESSPVLLPGIKLTAGKLNFTIEDDPFESELNYIYQLGLVEQRKRLEHLSLLEDRFKGKGSRDVSYESELQFLYKLFEQLWIRKVETYKCQLAKEIDSNRDYLFGSEGDMPDSGYEKIKPYSLHAPLLSVSLMSMNLDLWEPKFSLQDLPDFIHQHGQGVPKDTKYNLMIPVFLRLAVAEVRMDIRDYPLPLLYLPQAKDVQGVGKALKMEGHLILSEKLVLEEKNLRKLKIQLTDATNKSSLQPNLFDKLVIEKSLSTVKLYTDMDVVFDSNLPSRFIWGLSYQFGVQQIMLTIDQFSKPPIDPSPKLGFWDKLRLVIHGSLSIKTGEAASIEVGFKGGKDPYDLFGVSNGFILRFEDSVNWNINHHGSSKFFDILAGKVSWYVPNYLATPLTCWSRDSVNAVYLQKEEGMIHSCHGYYLGDRPSGTGAGEFNLCEKTVVELSGGVDFTVGFLLERSRKDKNGYTQEGKPHYEVELFNPKFTEANHDSYEGFRSDRLHMSISLKAHTEDSYNTIHLSPGVFTQIFSWWRMFQGNLLLPIRKGVLFQDFKKSQKFSKHLYLNQFLFDVKNLFISHVIQKETSDVACEEYGSVGLRAKVSQFLVDFHQKKEEVLDVHEDLARHKKVMKMKFNLGQILLNQIDLRTVEAQFQRDVYKQNQDNPIKKIESIVKIFDEDPEWFDTRDYEECFNSFNGNAKSARIHPFLYSETFAYLRDTTKDSSHGEDWAGEIHDCILHKTEYQSSEIELYKRRLDALEILSRENKNAQADSIQRRIHSLKEMIDGCKSARDSSHRKSSLVQLQKQAQENFHNRFLLVSMFLKWNEPVRNQFMKYIHFVNLRSIYRKFMSFEFMRVLEGMIEANENANQSSIESSFSGRRLPDQTVPPLHNSEESSQERFNTFDEILRLVCEDQQIVENYKIEIISPQIQLHSKELKNSVVMVTAPSLESKIVSVNLNMDALLPDDSTTTEKRYGVILRNASIMVIDKNDIEKIPAAFETKPYGTKSKWPPFLGIETCKNHEFASQDNVLVKQMSLMLTFQQHVALSSGFEQIEHRAELEDDAEDKRKNSADKLRVDVPRISINCTSKQYFTLYATILGLLLYVEPLAAELREKVLKLNFSIDFQDFRTLHERLLGLHKCVGMTTELLKNYSFRRGSLNNETLNDYLLLASKKASVETEIVLMQQTLFSGDVTTDSSSRIIQDWRIAADEIVLHMLNDDRTPIVDLSIAHGTYRRTVKDGGSNDNQVQIMNIEGLTLLPNSHFKRFLEPMGNAQKRHLIKIDWSMNQAIGGIKVIENFDISSLPLNVRIDEETGRLLVRFLFRQNEDEDISESPVFKVTDQEQPEKEDDEEEPEGSLSDHDGLDDDSRGEADATSTSKESSFATSSKKFLEDDVNAMVLRSKKYLSIAKLTSQLFELMISLRLKKGGLKWLNVTNFLLVLPRWHIEGKVLSLLEVVNHLKSIVIKALVSHSGALLKNKLSSRLRNLRRFTKQFEFNRSPPDARS